MHMKFDTSMHHIKRHIMSSLTYKKWCRFSEMRPKNVDSNLYNYHLRSLMKEGYIEKSEKGYRLTPRGLRFADLVSARTFEAQLQAKNIIMMLIKNSEGKIMLWKRKKQPFIESWTLPNGKTHYEDSSLAESVERDCAKFFDSKPLDYKQVGVVEVYAKIESKVVSHIIAHLYVVKIKEGSKVPGQTRWFSEDEIQMMSLAPAVKEILQIDTSSDKLTYHHFDVDW